MRRPNFFIVGAPKAGTSAMDYYLSQHPEVFMAEKELHYFAPDFIFDERYRRDLDSVFYLRSEIAVRSIHEFCPEAKILIHIRNPVDFMVSHHSQLLYVDLEDIEDFRTAYEAQSNRRQGKQMSRRCRCPAVLQYTELGQFSHQIKRYYDTFGREQVLVNVFDEFSGDTLGTYRRTLDFLAVDTAFTPEMPVVNANKTVRSKHLMRFIRNTPDWVTKGSHILLPPQARENLKRRVRHWNTRQEQRVPLDPEFKHRLQQEFVPEVERLSALLDRDLTGWCRS